MPRVGFEHPTPVFERKTTVLALDRAATVIVIVKEYTYIYDLIAELFSTSLTLKHFDKSNPRQKFSSWIPR
jgi:hypothetical protein